MFMHFWVDDAPACAIAASGPSTSDATLVDCPQCQTWLAFQVALKLHPVVHHEYRDENNIWRVNCGAGVPCLVQRDWGAVTCWECMKEHLA